MAHTHELHRSDTVGSVPATAEGDSGVVRSYVIEMNDFDATRHEWVLDQIRQVLAESGLQAKLVLRPGSLDRSIPHTGARERAVARGEQRLVSWINDGILVEGATLEKAWEMTRQGLDAARRRGALFSLWIKNQHWYPSEFLKFERSALAEVNAALGDIDPTDKLLFLLRTHGSLCGKSAADAVADGKLNDVLRVAKAWRDA